MRDISTDELSLLRQTFDASDVDGDGWIGNGEFARMLQVLDFALSVDECLLAFDVADIDGDGSISFEEFMEWWTAD